ncbi:hypothetical protein BH11PSE2_BH11PSE2_10110 [soil metagenome]
MSARVPTVFKGGGCADDTCAFDRWEAFLAAHGETPLVLDTDIVRLMRLGGSGGCPAASVKKDGVHIRRIDSRGEVMVQSDCGIVSQSRFSSAQTARLKAVLSDPAFAGLDGAFPAYCGEGEAKQDVDDGDDGGANLLEVVGGGHYRMIEWDCDVPPALAPLISLLDPAP